MEEKKISGPLEGELTEEELGRVTGGESGGATEIKMFLVDRNMVCRNFMKEAVPTGDPSFTYTGITSAEDCCGVCYYFLSSHGEREGVCARCDKDTYCQRGQMGPMMK